MDTRYLPHELWQRIVRGAVSYRSYYALCLVCKDWRRWVEGSKVEKEMMLVRLFFTNPGYARGYIKFIISLQSGGGKFGYGVVSFTKYDVVVTVIYGAVVKTFALKGSVRMATTCNQKQEADLDPAVRKVWTVAIGHLISGFVDVINDPFNITSFSNRIGEEAILQTPLIQDRVVATNVVYPSSTPFRYSLVWHGGGGVRLKSERCAVGPAPDPTTDPWSCSPLSDPWYIRYRH